MIKQRVLSVGTLTIAAAGAAGLLMLGTSNASTAGVLHKPVAQPSGSWDDDGDEADTSTKNHNKNHNWTYNKNKNKNYNENKVEVPSPTVTVTVTKTVTAKPCVGSAC